MKSNRFKVAKAFKGLMSKANAMRGKASGGNAEGSGTRNPPLRDLRRNSAKTAPTGSSTKGKAAKKGAKTATIRGKGKPMKFKKGALHAQLGVPEGEPIPARKKAAALAGKYGPLAKKRAMFAFKGALAKGRKKAGK